MVCHHHSGCNCDEEPLEWWKRLITTCVTVASALSIGNIWWSTIFTAYFFATAWLEWFKYPGRQEPDIVMTVAWLVIFPLYGGMLIACMLMASMFVTPWTVLQMDLTHFNYVWGMTSCIIILTRCVIVVYEEVRPYLIEELLSQEKNRPAIYGRWRFCPDGVKPPSR